ncbi:MAG TPA: beta-ribofuranosylaminobenzene 5'-phosphate synthase [Candidatus Lokiarchaeia archaeon]|nr:beta-ribofuranosylaminobenzene 5'-phosphate synthase [Candidatus Lokiarchaeia archaeon]
MKLQILTPSRIHATLIDMNGSLGRIDGSVGFTLANPGWKIIFETINDTQLKISLPRHFEGNYVEKLVHDILQQYNMSAETASMKISVMETISRHIGLGSKTQLALALADGISRLLKLEGTPLSKEILASVVKRGGTSGIGVTSYFIGGFIIDGGHDYGEGKEKYSFLPSSASNAAPAPVLFRDELPDEWRIVIAIPHLVQGAHDAEEMNIFKECCPVPLNDVEKLSHIILMKLMPAVKRKNFDDICECIKFFQTIGFKKNEIDLRGQSFRDMITAWQDAGAPCVGMTSFGPALYTIARDMDQANELKQSVDNIMSEEGSLAFITRMQNTGASIKYLS